MNSFNEVSEWIMSVVNNQNDDDSWNSMVNNLSEDELAVAMLLREKIFKYISEIDIMKEELAKSKKQSSFYQEALDSLPNPLFVKDGDSRFTFFNRKYEEVFGMKREEMIGKKVSESEYLSAEESAKYEREDADLLRYLKTVHYEAPFRFSDGKKHHSFYWNSAFIVKSSGERGIVGEIVDFTMQKKLEDDLSVSVDQLKQANNFAKQAYHTDFATGLSNRYVLNEKLPQLILKAKTTEEPITAFIADLDNFKGVNDKYGHGTGDEVLIGFAEVLKEVTRDTDICIRYGGEEFLVLMPNTNISEGVGVAEMVCKAFASKTILPDGSQSTVSIGATQYILGENVDHWINRADKALYIRKKSGKNGVASV